MYYAKNNKVLLLMLVDVLVLVAVFLLNMSFFRGEFLLTYNHSLGIILSALLITLFRQNYQQFFERSYDVELKETLLSSVQLLLFVVLIFSQGLKTYMPNRALLSLFITLWFFLFITRETEKKIYALWPQKEKNLMLVSDLENVDALIASLPSHKKVIGILSKDQVGKHKGIDVYPALEDIEKFLLNAQVDEVYVNLSSAFPKPLIFAWMNKIGITTHINIKNALQDLTGNYMFTQEGENVYITSSVRIAKIYQVFLKRLTDIFFGLLGCLFTLFLAALIWPIVQMQSPGPLFFVQKRVGKDGKFFKMYKFRSMSLDAEQKKADLMQQNEMQSDLMFKMENDPRIFPFGHFLRKTSLDEFPQFFNVLKGEMSVVGTRPPTVDEWRKYRLHHFKRLLTKPGITGLWQVSGRSNITDFEEVVKLDMEYISKWKLSLDLKIILKTFQVILSRKGSK